MKIFEIDILGFTLAPSYYGLMYALGFLFAYRLIVKRKKLSRDVVDDIFLYIFLGVVLGGRLGYIVFYNFSTYLENPLAIFKVWEGGMSFHGGVIGVIFAVYIFSRKRQISFLKIIDEIALSVPIGLGLGRIGNYLNGELLGYGGYNGLFAVNNRFPSPLLEAFLEGLVLFFILLYIAKRKKYSGQLGVFFLVFYGIFRMFVEVFFRVPDIHIGYIYGNFSLGSILSFCMIIAGIILHILLKKK